MKKITEKYDREGEKRKTQNVDLKTVKNGHYKRVNSDVRIENDLN